MNGRWVAVVAGAAMVAALGACDQYYHSEKATAGNLPSAPPDTTRGLADIVIKDSAFVPSGDTVLLGQAVTWKNFDSTQHSVTATPGSAEQFDSGPLLFGQTFTHRFTNPGLTRYVDRFRSTDTTNGRGQGTILAR